MAVKLPIPRKVLSNKRIGSNARVLQFEPIAQFIPGQVIGLSRTLGGVQRWYSIASAPSNEYAEVIYTLVADGMLTPELWELQAGDEVFVQGPRGSFLDPAGSRKVWWICNGTGVSPFLSYIRHAEFDDSKRLLLRNRTLVFGCRTIEDAFFLPEIDHACENYGLNAIICLSAGKATNSTTQGLHVHAGRLTTWEGLQSIPNNERAMLCGSSSMVSDLRDQLSRQGLPLDAIFAEIYF